METTTKKDVFERVKTNLLSLMENPETWQKTWQTVTQEPPRNYVSGRPYHGINVLLLSAGITPYWLTFNQAKNLGGSVRKGEHGTYIVLALPVSVTEKNKTGEEEERTFFTYRGFTVFNVSQCEGLPAKDQKPETTARVTGAEEIIQKNNPVIVRGNPAYIRGADTIAMPGIDEFTGADEYYVSLFHELTHWTGAPHRLNREKGKTFGDDQYAREELIAEFGAQYLAAIAGLEGTAKNSAAYLAAWSSRLKETKARDIVSAISQAEKATTFLTSVQA